MKSTNTSPQIPNNLVPPSMRKHRLAALLLSLLGVVVNVAVAAQLLSLCRSLKWDSDSEWEGSADGWRVDGIKIVWGLLTAYFSTAAIACLVGFIGVIKRIPSYVRLYRDYAVADLCFSALSTVLLSLASFRPAVRATTCEELSRQPELLRDLAEAGLNLENCEQWFEHAVVIIVAVTTIVLVVRLQFIITVSTYYKQLVRHQLYSSMEFGDSPIDHGSPHRIYLLPTRSSISSATDLGLTSHHHSTALHGHSHSRSRASSSPNVLIYAPVPLNSLTEEQVRDLDATEAWVSRTEPHSHSHSRRHRSHSRTRSQASATHRHGGRISLPIRTGEGLLPSYNDVRANVNPNTRDESKV